MRILYLFICYLTFYCCDKVPEILRKPRGCVKPKGNLGDIRTKGCSLFECLKDKGNYKWNEYCQPSSKIPWEEVVDTNCFEEHGATNIYPDPWETEKASLEKCKNYCLLHRLCSGIVWETQQEKCHLRKDIEISKCDKDNGYNLYKLPEQTTPKPPTTTTTTEASTTTISTTTTTKPPPEAKVFYAGGDYDYYKVTVASGTRLMEGVVADTCKEAGMEAVCAGPSSCSYSSSKCLVTPLSTDCNYPLKPIFSKLSSKTDTDAAEELEGVFTYMNHWYGGESGYVGESFNVQGNSYVAGEHTYYAYCVLCGECNAWSSWTRCERTCKRSRNRTCAGGSGCSKSEETCRGGQCDQATVLLHAGGDYDYYRVHVATGTRLRQGVVVDTCKAAGMEAVCAGPTSCTKTSNRCLQTPLSTDCQALSTISSLICNYTDPRQCADLEGVFNYVNNWYNSDAGVVGSSWWARGESYVSGEQTYYAFCADCAQCPAWSSWSSCQTNCKRIKSRNCTAGCSKSEEPCQGGQCDQSKILLYKSGYYDYYKVPVTCGNYLTEGVVVDTCKAAGMEAVCSGSSSCGYSSNICLVTPLSSDCNNPFRPLSIKMCNTPDPKQCKELNGVFSYVNNYYYGAAGVSGSSWWASGYSAVSGKTPLYAYCVQCGSCEGWTTWTQCQRNCKRSRTRQCTGSGCLFTLEEDCQGDLCDQDKILLYANGGYDYYRVPILSGTRLLEGVVADTCKAAGMEAVCAGPSSCKYTSSRCLVTPLSMDCSALRPIAGRICHVVDPRQCKEMDGLFSYMNDYYGGEAGVVGGTWLAQGKSYVSGEKTYYAYCVQCGSCTAWSEWTKCQSNCKRTRTRTCTGGSGCSKGEEACQGGLCDQAKILLYANGGYDYYRVPIASGTRLLEGVVADTCKAAGMEAVCAGTLSCKYTSSRCLVTPLSMDCSSPLRPIAGRICHFLDPKQCIEMDGLFSYMNDYYYGEAGAVGGTWLAGGKSYVSGEKTFYAYCVQCGSCAAWSGWTKCQSNCKRTRTRTCTLGSGCSKGEEACQGGLCDQKKILLYISNGYAYYRVPVAHGTRLIEGTVADTCEAVGMEAVCAGHSSCRYASSRCLVTPLSTDCDYPLRPISIHLCNFIDPKQCEELEGVFSYMKNWYGGEAGVVGASWLAQGKSFSSGEKTYFAYCVAVTK